MYALVAPFKTSFDDIGISYHIPPELLGIQEGSIVEVPLRGKTELGVIVKISDEPTYIEKQVEIKDIIDIKSDILLPLAQRTLISWIASHFFVLIHASCTLFFPKNLQDKLKKNTLKNKQKQAEISLDTKITLSPAQEKIYEKILTSKDKKILFWGVMGSGKTEIYIELVRQNFLAGKQSLVLIPEIILSNQIAQRFKEVFGEDIPVINSTLSDAKKTLVWQGIYSKNYNIILGTRSALFYPYQNLGLIIIDEEHDGSYSSDNGPRYNAREVVFKLSDLTGAKIVLASGTPSIQSMYKATQKEYQLITLLEKFDKNI